MGPRARAGKACSIFEREPERLALFSTASEGRKGLLNFRPRTAPQVPRVAILHSFDAKTPQGSHGGLPVNSRARIFFFRLVFSSPLRPFPRHLVCASNNVEL